MSGQTPSTDDEGSLPARGPAALLLAFMWGAYFLNYCDRQAVFAMFPALKAELAMSDRQLGYVGAVFLWIYALGCPLAGDAEYGGPGAKRRRRGTALGTHLGSARAPVERVMLHAVELTLPHPVTGVAISLRCEPPPDFLALAGAMMPLSLKV